MIKNPWKERARSCFIQFLQILAHSPLSIIVAIGIGAIDKYINTSIILEANVITIWYFDSSNNIITVAVFFTAAILAL